MMENETEGKTEKKSATDPKIENTLSVMSLAWELGYIIAIPLVILTLSGRFLDKKLGTSPLLLLAGVVLSIVFSTYTIYKKTIDIIDKK